jgi:hypothetical protein
MSLFYNKFMIHVTYNQNHTHPSTTQNVMLQPLPYRSHKIETLIAETTQKFYMKTSSISLLFLYCAVCTLFFV